MEIGVVFPQTEIGQDPAVIRDYAQAVEAIGYQLTSAMTHRIVIAEVGRLMKKKSKKSARASRVRSPKPVAKRDYMVRDPANRTRKLKVRLPAKSTAADQAEAQRHVEMLEATGQIAREPGAMPPGTTHRVETDSAGDTRLVRKRFSAI